MKSIKIHARNNNFQVLLSENLSIKLNGDSIPTQRNNTCRFHPREIAIQITPLE